jgi:hypothetical protein
LEEARAIAISEAVPDLASEAVREHRSTVPEQEGDAAADPVRERASETVRTVRLSGLGVPLEDAAEGLAETVGARVNPAEGTSGCAVDDAPALAHDACNLLSALGLYGELLAFPGVLDEHHRHYAEELKLLAARSEVLIGRLLRSSAVEAPSAQDPAAQVLSAQARDLAGVLPGAVRQSRPPSDLRPDLRPDSPPDSQTDVASGLGSMAEIETKTGTEMPGTEMPGTEIKTAIEGGHTEVGHTEVGHTEVEQTGLSPTGLSPTNLSPTNLSQSNLSQSNLSQSNLSQTNLSQSNLSQTNLVDLLMRWGSLLSTLAHGTLEVAFGPGAATPVPAGAEALERILVNLVRNARAATVAGGSIRIGVAAAKPVAAPVGAAEGAGGPECGRLKRGTVVLTVDDSGCGMSEAQVKRILGIESGGIESGGIEPGGIEPGVIEPGFIDPAGGVLEDGVAGGAVVGGLPAPGPRRRRGLGLQIVRELVAASGGELFLQSMPGRGTRIEIHWPAAGSLGAAAQPVPAPTFAAPGLEVPGPHRPALDRPALDRPALDRELPDLAGTPAARLPNTVPESALKPGLETAPRERAGAEREGATGGFSEEQLRAMMLRLHRSVPGERIRAGTGARAGAPRRSEEFQVSAASRSSDLLRSDAPPSEASAGYGARAQLGGLAQKQSPPGQVLSGQVLSGQVLSGQVAGDGPRGEPSSGGPVRVGNGIVFPLPVAPAQNGDRDVKDDSGLKGAIAC